MWTGSIKDRKGMDLTEAENIKERWQEYTEELYIKDLHDPDNHNGVITHLEPDILKFEVKWALSPQTTSVSEGLLLTHFADGKTEAELRESSSISRPQHSSTDEPLPWRSWPGFPRRYVGACSHHARGPDEEAGTQRLPWAQSHSPAQPSPA